MNTAKQGRLFESTTPARARRIDADVEPQGLTVTLPQYCDLCGREDDCLLMVDAPGHPQAVDDLLDLCCECSASQDFLAAYIANGR